MVFFMVEHEQFNFFQFQNFQYSTNYEYVPFSKYGLFNFDIIMLVLQNWLFNTQALIQMILPYD